MRERILEINLIPQQNLRSCKLFRHIQPLSCFLLFMFFEILLGDEAMERLARARVAVFGIGGVGGYVCEALARSGVGELDLIDDDRGCLT